MKTLRLAALMLVIYAVLNVANTLFYYSWSGDSSELPRVAVRTGTMLISALGLMQAQRWAWWIGLIVSLLHSLFFITFMPMMIFLGILADRPYPVVDYIVLTALAVLTFGTVVSLLMPQSRAALRSSVQKA